MNDSFLIHLSSLFLTSFLFLFLFYVWLLVGSTYLSAYLPYLPTYLPSYLPTYLLQWRRRQEVSHRTGVFLCCYDVVISDDTREVLDRILRSKAWFATVYLSVVVSITLLTLRSWKPVKESNDYDDGSDGGGNDDASDSTTTAHHKSIESSLLPAVEVVLAAATCLVFAVEQLLRLVVLPPLECWPVAKQLELFISAAYCFGVRSAERA
jgi:hypothetical protein